MGSQLGPPRHHARRVGPSRTTPQPDPERPRPESSAPRSRRPSPFPPSGLRPCARGPRSPHPLPCGPRRRAPAPMPSPPAIPPIPPVPAVPATPAVPAVPPAHPRPARRRHRLRRPGWPRTTCPSSFRVTSTRPGPRARSSSPTQRRPHRRRHRHRPPSALPARRPDDRRRTTWTTDNGRALPSYDYLFGHTTTADEHRKALAQLTQTDDEDGGSDEDEPLAVPRRHRPARRAGHERRPRPRGAGRDPSRPRQSRCPPVAELSEGGLISSVPWASRCAEGAPARPGAGGADLLRTAHAAPRPEPAASDDHPASGCPCPRGHSSDRDRAAARDPSSPRTQPGTQPARGRPRPRHTPDRASRPRSRPSTCPSRCRSRPCPAATSRRSTTTRRS